MQVITNIALWCFTGSLLVIVFAVSNALYNVWSKKCSTRY